MKKRFLCLFLCVLMLLPFGGCAYEPQSVDIALVENGTAALYIQIPQDAPREVLYAKDRLVFHVQKLTGVTLECGTEPPADAAVLTLGNTVDEASEKEAEKLEGAQFRIFASGNKITAVASNNAFLFDAVGYLIEKMSYDAAANTLRLSGVLDAAVAGNTSTLMYMFTQSGTVDGDSIYYATVPFHPGADGELGTADDVKGTQGGCRVGNYHYQCIIKTDKESNQMNNITYVVKYDLTAKQTVLCSELLQLNHANDITYNEKTGELVIVHNAPRGKMLTFMDPETLTVTRTGELPISVYSIGYSAARNMYVVGVSGGQNMRRITADLQYADGKTIRATKLTEHYTTQGITADDYFIYCALYDSMHKGATNMQNVITVYDWYGNYVGLIEANVGKNEPENISIDENGNIHVLAYATGKGGHIYNIELKGPVLEEK